MPLFSFSQDIKKTDIEKFNISVELADNWKIKNSNQNKYILIENSDLKSSIRIQNSDYQETYKKILKNKGLEKSKEYLNRLSELNNAKIKLSYNKSEIKEKTELISTDIIINSKAYFIKTNIPNNCSKCKKEFESMVSSIEQI